MDIKKAQKAFKTFISEAYKTTDLESTISCIKTYAADVLACFDVAKWEMVYFSPADISQAEDITKKISTSVIGGPVNETGFVNADFVTGGGGSVAVTYYPVLGREWSEEEKSMLETMWQIIFSYMGRGKIFSSFNRANCTDSMTNAPNRSGLERHIGRLIASNTMGNYTSAFINIKNFRHVNDRLGKFFGDEYMKKFCAIIMSQIEDDEIFARMGGDNFVLICQNNRRNELGSLLRHIEFDISYRGRVEHFKPKFYCGIYQMQSADGMHEVMQRASQAYQLARLPGMDDFVWYNESMLHNGYQARQVQDAFPNALKNCEFVVYYQPKVSVDNLTLCGAEALCRWISDGHMISPAEFIPPLERDGSVTQLDFYMLERVCRDLKVWGEKGVKPQRVSVNFSKHHLSNGKFGKNIVDIIDKYQLDHGLIEVELTEMSGHSDYSEMVRFVNYLHQQGIATSVDDFGTGYSSLNMLTEMQADIVKLDKSFIDGMLDDKEISKKLVKNIIHMINELEMESVAEGVELQKQVEMLKEWNCKVIQGYYFDRPLPPEEFEKRLLNPVYA